MRKEYAAQPGAGEVKAIDWKKMVTDADLAVKIIDRQIEERKIDIKGAGIIVAGGYGMGSKENFRLVHELADGHLDQLGPRSPDQQDRRLRHHGRCQ